MSEKQEREALSPEEISQIIRSIKRQREEEFQEKLKSMTPEEQETAIEWANDMD